MSGRGATAAVLAELVKGSVTLVHLFELHLDSGTIYNTDSYRDRTWNGHTYLANGHHLGFSPIEETADSQITKVSASLTGVEQTYVALLLSEAYIDRLFRIYACFCDASDSIVSSPLLIFDGRIDGAAIDEAAEAGTVTIAVEATSLWVDFERRPGRHTNYIEQQIHFPGDRAFLYTSNVNRQLVWGRP